MNSRHLPILIGSLILIGGGLAAQSRDNEVLVRKHVAKVTVYGKITDQATGEYLAGASIYFPDLKAGAVSNSEGNYRMRNLPEGRYLVEVSFLGYASIVEHITLKGDMQKDFFLGHSVVENEAVTVTGVSSATSLRRSPIPVNIVKRLDLLKSASTNLIDALSHTPGVSQISTGPAISKPTIRGLGYNRLVVMNDGIRQEGQQWGDEHGIEIDEYSVNKVEVLKGPASIMYGSDALAGVINILTNIPVEEGTIKGNILSNVQSNNGLIGLNANVAGNLNGINWNVYGSRKSAYDYKNKYDGRVFNSKFREQNFGGYFGVNKSWGYSHLLVSNFDQHPGLIEGERDSIHGKFLKLVNLGGMETEVEARSDDFRSRNAFIPAQEVNHFKISLENSFRLRNSRITFNIGYQRNKRKEFGDILQPGRPDLFFDLNTINYNVQYHFPENKDWKTSIGANGMQQENANKGIESLIPEYRLFDIGGFMYSKRTFERVTLSGGVRLDKRVLNSRELYDGTDVKFQKLDRHFSNISASAGLSYEPGEEVTLKFNIARGFRAPGVPELTTNGAHEGTNRYEYGERTLKSETSLQMDAGIDVNTQHVSLSASLFYNRIANFIYYRKLAAVNGGDSLVNVNGDHKLAFTFDQNNAQLYGAEFNLDIHPHPLDWLHIENTFSYVRGTLSEAQDGSKNLPFIPAARLINQLRADFPSKSTALRSAFISIEFDNTFAQQNPFTGFATETKTPAYSLINVGFGGDVTRKGKVLFSVFFAGNNLTDKSYQNHLSRLKYTMGNPATGRPGVYNMGRNFSLKLNVPIVFFIKKM